MKIVILLFSMTNLVYAGAGSHQALTKRASYPTGVMKTLTCPKTNQPALTCLTTDLDSWPTKDITCQHNIRLDALQKVANAIKSETSPPQPESMPPPNLRAACKDKTVYRSIHGDVHTFYTWKSTAIAKTVLNLSVKMQSSKLLLRVTSGSRIVYCGVSVGGTVCSE
ncbi:hypothetical protein PSHT_03973 [Puccinia striiformis]|uniref:Uncharacterized protein n=1 Tax=Puccinia striiformis TaxID=27350 RepID=A0A2S4WE53_9BASI|nr:hypothetical protein PSHT_03973 [Puccinia striiformis]